MAYDTFQLVKTVERVTVKSVLPGQQAVVSSVVIILELDHI